MFFFKKSKKESDKIDLKTVLTDEERNALADVIRKTEIRHNKPMPGLENTIRYKGKINKKELVLIQSVLRMSFMDSFMTGKALSAIEGEISSKLRKFTEEEEEDKE